MQFIEEIIIPKVHSNPWMGLWVRLSPSSLARNYISLRAHENPCNHKYLGYSLENFMNISRLPKSKINTVDESWDIIVPRIWEETIRNAHIQMVPNMSFSKLPRCDMDIICWNMYPGVIPKNYEKIWSIIPRKA
jgi:hypothetical protein